MTRNIFGNLIRRPTGACSERWWQEDIRRFERRRRGNLGIEESIHINFAVREHSRLVNATPRRRVLNWGWGGKSGEARSILKTSCDWFCRFPHCAHEFLEFLPCFVCYYIFVEHILLDISSLSLWNIWKLKMSYPLPFLSPQSCCRKCTVFVGDQAALNSKHCREATAEGMSEHIRFFLLVSPSPITLISIFVYYRRNSFAQIPSAQKCDTVVTNICVQHEWNTFRHQMLRCHNAE